MTNRALRIILMGNIGVGKGTQAQRMSEAFAIPHISTGDIFRKHIQHETEIGKGIKQCMDAGELVPDNLTCEIVSARIVKSDCDDGYILDGFPRSLPQAEALHEFLQERGLDIDVAVNIQLPDDEIVDRLTSRRSCPRCGAIYNLKFNPPVEEGICDVSDCGAELVQRDDDKVDTIQNRLKIYYDTTKPILSYYEDLGVLHTIDVSGLTPDDVFTKVESIVSGIGAVSES